MGEQIIQEYKLHNPGLGHIMLWRGGRSLSKHYLTTFLFKSYFTDQLKTRPFPQSSLATFRLLIKRKGFTRGEMERRKKEVSLNLLSPFLCYLTQQVS